MNPDCMYCHIEHRREQKRQAEQNGGWPDKTQAIAAFWTEYKALCERHGLALYYDCFYLAKEIGPCAAGELDLEFVNDVHYLNPQEPQ